MSYKGSIPALVRISFLIVLSAGWCLSKNCTKDDAFVDIYPGDCRKYIECKHGKEEVKECVSSATHRFDHKLLKCVSVWPNKVDCESPSPWGKAETSAGPLHNESTHNEPIYIPTVIEPIEHPIHNGKPAETTTEKPAQNPAEKPTEKPAQKPSEKPKVKSTSKPAEKPADKPTEKPADKPTEKPAGKAPTATTSAHQPTAIVAPVHPTAVTPTKPSHPAATTSTAAPTKHSTQRVTSTVSNPGHKHENTTIPSVTVTTPKNATKKNGSPSSTSVSIITLVVLTLTVGVLR